MDAVDELDEYRPREEDALLVLTVEPAKSSLRLWSMAAFTCLMVIWLAKQTGRPDVGAALLLPALFVLFGIRVLMANPARTVLRFLGEGIEFDTQGRGWVRVPWNLITQLVQDGLGGAALNTASREEGGMTVARLPKEQLDALLAAAILPAHVKIIEAPTTAAPKHSWKRTFGLWLLLIVTFAAIWQLTRP